MAVEIAANTYADTSTAKMEETLRSLVQYYLENLMHSNAIFLCERLVACNGSEENVLLLATCHVMQSSESTAHALLQGCRLPESRFLLANCCMDIGKPADAERVLLEGTSILHKGPKEGRGEILADPCPIPFGAAGLRLLGLACQGTGRRESAEEYFRLSLELDPMMWVNVQSLCELGADLDMEKLFEESIFSKQGMAATPAVAAAMASGKSGKHRAQRAAPAPGWARAGWGGHGKRSPPWAPYAAFSRDPTGGRCPGYQKGDDGAAGAAATVGAGTGRAESSRRSVGRGRGKDVSVVGGGALFGTPTPSQRRVTSSGYGNSTRTSTTATAAAAAATTTYGDGGGNVFMTPSSRTPARTSDIRLNARGGDVMTGDAGRGASNGGGGGGGGATVGATVAFRLGSNGGSPGAAGERGAAAAEESRLGNGDGIGHLIGLGARLGTFFPSAVGPGPVPGLEQMLQQASDVVSTAEQYPPTPGYKYSGVGFLGGGSVGGETGAGAGAARLLATPGLTPIPTARTPDGGFGSSAVGAADQDTPSMFLAGLLRGGGGGGGGSPAVEGVSTTPMVGTTGSVGGVSMRVTPGGHDDEDGAAGARATRMAAAGLGPPTTGWGGGTGDARGRDTVGSTAGGRVTRAAGGRRVGGRLSFSSAVGTDDGSGSEGGLATAATLAERARALVRTQSRRRVSTPSTSNAHQSRQQHAPSERNAMRPPPPAGVGSSSSSAGTAPASAALAGRSSRSLTAAAAATSAAASGPRAGEGEGPGERGAKKTRSTSASTPIDVDNPAGGRSESSGSGTATRRRSRESRDENTSAATGRRRSGGVGGGVGRASFVETTPVTTQSSRRPTTRATAARKASGVAGGTKTTGMSSAKTVLGAEAMLRSSRGKKSGSVASSSGSGSVRGPPSSSSSAAAAAAAAAAGAAGAAAVAQGAEEEGGEVRLTRAEWQAVQYDETISYAMKHANQLAMVSEGVSSAASTSASGTAAAHAAPENEYPGSTEAVMALLAVVKAAHATNMAVTALGGDGGTAESTSATTTAGGGYDPKLLQESMRRLAGAGVDSPLSKLGGHSAGQGEGGNGGDGGSPAAALCIEGVRAVAALLLVLGKAYQHLTQYRCPEALKELERLSPQQYCTGWVLHQVGRAHFERADYASAKSALESMQRYDPHRMEGLDLLSTTLWHLKRDVELSYLAQKVSEFDRLSPHTWCVVGNCFSLQKEHETALRFFQRAIQLDADMTYAYTLCGHEYVANEDFDKAVACFRMAIRTDRRHYNAWYGLGSIYHRQEKYDMAEYHFRRALRINPQSSVLQVYLGMVLHANKRYLDALDMLELASKSEPRNPQASFQRANVLMSMERYAEALRELEVVRDNVPKESAVYFLMGKVCKKLGRTDAAMRHFTIALDLHNKDKNLIKAAVDRLNDPDLDEEEKF